MIGRIIATAALGGTLALGGTAAASAAPTTTASRHFDCANAPKALSRINTLESKAQSFVTKATARETAATNAGHPKVAKRIGRRIAFVERREARGTTLVQRIETACPGATAAS
jgi:hypothetical protein